MGKIKSGDAPISGIQKEKSDAFIEIKMGETIVFKKVISKKRSLKLNKEKYRFQHGF